MAVETLNKTEVELPHGPGFRLLSDVHVITADSAVGEYVYESDGTLRLRDHFPEYQVFPGALLVEAMAQNAIQIAQRNVELQGKLFILTGIHEAKFRQAILPGSTIILESKLESYRHGVGKAICFAKVSGKQVAEATITFTTVS